MRSAEALSIHSRILIGQLVKDCGLNIQSLALPFDLRATVWNWSSEWRSRPVWCRGRDGCEKNWCVFCIVTEIGHKDAYIMQEVRTWLSKPKFSLADEERDILTTDGKEVCVLFTRRMPFTFTVLDNKNAKQILSTVRERPKWSRIR